MAHFQSPLKLHILYAPDEDCTTQRSSAMRPSTPILAFLFVAAAAAVVFQFFVVLLGTSTSTPPAYQLSHIEAATILACSVAALAPFRGAPSGGSLFAMAAGLAGLAHLYSTTNYGHLVQSVLGVPA